MSTTIYDENEARPARRFSGLLTLAVGIGLSAWYVRDMGRTISGDIQAFSLSFRALPLLTVVFAVFRLAAYLLSGALFAVMIYVPLRNLWLTKFLTGRIGSVERSEKPSYISVKLDDRVFRFRDPGGLKPALDEKTSSGDSVRLTVGAFGRVSRVEKLD